MDSVEVQRGKIARELGFFTEQEVMLIAGVKAETLEYWRKKGKGPEYIYFGTSFLYPAKHLDAYLHELVKRKEPDMDLIESCITE